MKAGETVLPPRSWIKRKEPGHFARPSEGPYDALWRKQVLLLKKTTVAYGVVALLRRAAAPVAAPGSNDS